MADERRDRATFRFGMCTPFKMDLRMILAAAERKHKDHVRGITINLPWVAVQVDPVGREKKVAREIVIRLADKRVLSANECCDDCIKASLSSLQEVRSLLVDKQVELSDSTDSLLYLLLQLMLEAIRQFLTYEERLRASLGRQEHAFAGEDDSFLLRLHKEEYVSALEILRAHLNRCIIQLRKLAGLPEKAYQPWLKYTEEWSLADYEPPQLGDGV